jgi:hypothetical protein
MATIVAACIMTRMPRLLVDLERPARALAETNRKNACGASKFHVSVLSLIAARESACLRHSAD